MTGCRSRSATAAQSTAPSESLDCCPKRTRSAPSFSSAAASAREVATRSEPAAASSVISTARSAPMASALRSESSAPAGPIDTRTTSPSPPASFSFSASSTACESKWLSAPSPERSSLFVPGSMRLWTAASGTSLTQTAIFIGRDSNHGAEVLSLRGHAARLRDFERDRPLMVSLRTTARALLVAALFGFAAGSAAAFPVDPGPPPPPPPSPPAPPHPKPKKQIVFPVLGTVDFTNDYGAPRPQGRHEGIDILAPRHAYALAAEAGRVRFYTGRAGPAACSTSTAGAGRPTTTST